MKEEFKHYYTHYLANLGNSDSYLGRLINGAISVGVLGLMLWLMTNTIFNAVLFFCVYMAINFVVANYLDPVEKDFEIPKWKETLYFTVAEFIFVYHFVTGKLNLKTELAKAEVAKEKK